VDDDAAPFEAPETAAPLEDDSETCDLDVRSKLMRLSDGKWNDCGIVVTRLLRDVANPAKRRVVARSTVGVVMLNVAVGSGFQYNESRNKKGGGGGISFRSEKGLVMIKVAKDSLEKLFEAFKKLTE